MARTKVTPSKADLEKGRARRLAATRKVNPDATQKDVITYKIRLSKLYAGHVKSVEQSMGHRDIALPANTASELVQTLIDTLSKRVQNGERDLRHVLFSQRPASSKKNETRDMIHLDWPGELMDDRHKLSRPYIGEFHTWLHRNTFERDLSGRNNTIKRIVQRHVEAFVRPLVVRWNQTCPSVPCSIYFYGSTVELKWNMMFDDEDTSN